MATTELLLGDRIGEALEPRPRRSRQKRFFRDPDTVSVHLRRYS
jgi:hypothetical protein